MLPLDDVESGAIDLAGRLRGARRPARRGARQPQQTAERRRLGARRSPTPRTRSPPPAPETAGSARSCSACSTTSRTRPESADAKTPPDCCPPRSASLLAERLQGRPTRANFRTGHLTICTLVPMRSVPHRVVCLLGLDDGVFPRKSHRDGDDLMLADPHVGDRDRRTEDRQMLLDALLAATDRLIITYTGNDERTNSRARRPCRSASCSTSIDRTVRTEDGDGRAHADRRPPPAAAVRPAQLRRRRPSAAVELRPRRARRRHGDRGPRDRRQPFLRAPARRRTQSRSSSSSTSCASSEQPVRAFLRQRLGISVADYDDDVSDALPVELDAPRDVGGRAAAARGLLAGARAWTPASPPRSRAGRCRPGALSADGDRRACGRPSRRSPDRRRSCSRAAGEPGSVESTR